MSFNPTVIWAIDKIPPFVSCYGLVSLQLPTSLIHLLHICSHGCHHVFLGHLFFLFLWGFHLRSCLVMLVAGFCRMWPIYLYRWWWMSAPIGLCLFHCHSFLLLFLSGRLDIALLNGLYLPDLTIYREYPSEALSSWNHDTLAFSVFRYVRMIFFKKGGQSSRNLILKLLVTMEEN